MSNTDSTVLDGIIYRKFLSKTDGLVFVGHGADINGYVSSRIYRNKDNAGDSFFPDTIPGGETATANLNTVSGVVKLSQEFDYSAYEITTLDDDSNLSSNDRDKFIGRGVVHEWIHQIIVNNISEALGSRHSSDDNPVPARYDDLRPEDLVNKNMMTKGDIWKFYKNPTIKDNLFTILSADIRYITIALGASSIPTETVTMRRVAKSKSKQKLHTKQ